MTGLPGRLVLLGHPVGHSLSPVFQNAALAAANIPLAYEALEVAPDDLRVMVGLLAEVGAAGNVTIPHKEAFARLCGERTPIAERVGAVNTFWTEDGALVGDNTDVGGFDAAVRDGLGMDTARLDVAVIGAGGGAAAVVAAVERWDGARVRVWSRRAEQARQLAQRFPGVAVAADDLEHMVRHARLVVNATPLGLTGDQLPFDLSWLPADAPIADLAYRKPETPLVLGARAAGHRAIDGKAMLIEQGALAFERWFGRPPDRAVMRAAIR